MEKRKYPLFVIDNSRAHGRGKECDFICCTDSYCPFTASVELLQGEDYKRLYDKNDYCAIWSDPHNGIRIYIHIVSDIPVDKERTKSLLRRALKEMMIRRPPVTVNINDVSNEAVENFADVLIQQKCEQIRKYGENSTDKAVMAILKKIKEDYGKRISDSDR